MNNILTLKTQTKILNHTGKKAIALQAALLICALALPAICHLLNLSVKTFLPMHWPVILAGLVYGWRSGLILGIAAPAASFMLSGMPAGHALMLMTLELAAYGFMAGLCREKFNFNFPVAALAALISGKAVYLLAALAVKGVFSVAFIHTGLIASLAQLIILPVLAYKWAKAK